ncbi:MAG: hypothetical protein LWX07_09725 [Bacteroidetes bacterium]|nr:hypothetical protein [Bacteroidota bacterium]
MKIVFRKYCTFKFTAVILLLVSFNLVTFGNEINDCLCKKKVEKKSCCTKKTETNCAEKKETEKSCCKKDGKKECPSCKMDNFNGENRNEGTVIPGNSVKTEVNNITTENLFNDQTSQTSKYFLLKKSPPGVRSKLFLDISTLII